HVLVQRLLAARHEVDGRDRNGPTAENTTRDVAQPTPEVDPAGRGVHVVEPVDATVRHLADAQARGEREGEQLVVSEVARRGGLSHAEVEQDEAGDRSRRLPQTLERGEHRIDVRWVDGVLDDNIAVADPLREKDGVRFWPGVRCAARQRVGLVEPRQRVRMAPPARRRPEQHAPYPFLELGPGPRDARPYVRGEHHRWGWLLAHGPVP